MIYGDLFRQVILFGLTITTAIILGLVAALVNKTLLYLIVGPIDMALLGTALYRELNLTQHISGLLELSGKAFLHQEGLRGQQAKIVFLIRPFSMSRRKARTLAEHYSVPVFSWWHWKKIYRHTKLVGRRLSGDIMMSLEQARDYDAGQKPQTLLGSIN